MVAQKKYNLPKHSHWLSTELIIAFWRQVQSQELMPAHMQID